MQQCVICKGTNLLYPGSLEDPCPLCEGVTADETEPDGLVLKISSPAFCGTPATDLLTRLCFRPGKQNGPFKCGVLYLHGFPDQSLDHRCEEPTYGALSSRFPQKLADAILKEFPDAVFSAFNFSGTPGSDLGFSFRQKMVSREVEDARAVIGYLRTYILPAPAPLVIVGLSTGAIIGSLLRGYDPHLCIALVASLLDVRKGLHFDFNESQLADFGTKRFCMKEFFLPSGSPSNPTDAEKEAHAADSSATWCKHHLPLDAAYVEDFLKLDIPTAVQAGASPLLVIHGGADKNIPMENGEELFGAARQPKKMVKIPKGNHLLTGSKDFQKAARGICDFISEYGKL